MRAVAACLVALALWASPARAAGPWYVDSVGGDGSTCLSWATACATFAAVLAKAVVAGDTIYVGDNSAETTASAVTWTFPGTSASPNFIYCADHTVATPGTGNLKTTCTASTTGASNIIVLGSLYAYGMQLKAGSGASIAALRFLSSAAGWQKWDSSLLQLNNTSTTSNMFFGTDNNTSLVLTNTQVQFGNATQTIQMAGDVLIENVASFIQGTVPTALFSSANGFAGTLTMNAVDLSAAGSGKTIIGDIPFPLRTYFRDVKLGASAILATAPTNRYGAQTRFFRSDSAATAYYSGKSTYNGVVVPNTTIVRTSGASDGTTPISWQFVTSANTNWVWPLQGSPIVTNITATGGSIIMTLEGIWNGAAIPNNDDIWTSVEYLGSASNSLGSVVAGTKANNLATGSALSASTKAWDSQVPAWAATTTYAQGQAIKSVNNAGRVFFCQTVTTGCITGSSEEAGFASAVDGGSVNVATGTFRAGWRFTIDTTATSPNASQKGYAIVTPNVAKPSIGCIAGTAGCPGTFFSLGAATTQTSLFIDPLVTQH